MQGTNYEMFSLTTGVQRICLQSVAVDIKSTIHQDSRVINVIKDMDRVARMLAFGVSDFHTPEYSKHVSTRTHAFLCTFRRIVLVSSKGGLCVCDPRGPFSPPPPSPTRGFRGAGGFGGPDEAV